MRAKIKGKTYDTDKASVLAQNNEQMLCYRENCGYFMFCDTAIMPVDAEEAMMWTADNCTEMFNVLFPDAKLTPVYIRAELRENIKTKPFKNNKYTFGKIQKIAKMIILRLQSCVKYYKGDTVCGVTLFCLSIHLTVD